MNTHSVFDNNGRVWRGMAPLSQADVQSLADHGVNEVLIFRNDVPGETGVSDEIKLLRNEPRIQKIHHLPFPWKDIQSFQEACEVSVKGLRVVLESERTKGSHLFFHCTVGEDRTGFLASLSQILLKKKNPELSFQEDMCQKGFSWGNPKKPEYVAQIVYDHVGLLYAKMRVLIESQKITPNKLSLDICQKDPLLDPKTKQRVLDIHKGLKCSPAEIN